MLYANLFNAKFYTVDKIHPRPCCGTWLASSPGSPPPLLLVCMAMEGQLGNGWPARGRAWMALITCGHDQSRAPGSSPPLSSTKRGGEETRDEASAWRGQLCISSGYQKMYALVDVHFLSACFVI